MFPLQVEKNYKKMKMQNPSPPEKVEKRKPEETKPQPGNAAKRTLISKPIPKPQNACHICNRKTHSALLQCATCERYYHLNHHSNHNSEQVRSIVRKHCPTCLRQKLTNKYLERKAAPAQNAVAGGPKFEFVTC